MTPVADDNDCSDGDNYDDGCVSASDESFQYTPFHLVLHLLQFPWRYEQVEELH